MDFFYIRISRYLKCNSKKYLKNILKIWISHHFCIIGDPEKRTVWEFRVGKNGALYDTTRCLELLNNILKTLFYI